MFRSFFLLLTIFLPGPGSIAQSIGPVGQVRAHMESWRFDQAVSVADDALKQDSLNTELLLLKGRALVSLCRYREAVETLGAAERTDSSDVAVCFELMNACRLSGDYDAALRAALRMITLEPGNRFFRTQLAGLFDLREEFNNELSILLGLYFQDTNSLYVLKRIAACYSDLKKPDSAYSFYQKALRIDSADAVVISRMVNIMIQRKDIPGAYRLTNCCIRRDSGNSVVLRLNGYINYLIQQYEPAKFRFRQCIELGDTSRFVMKNMGLCYYKQEMYDSATLFFLSSYLSDTTDAESCFYYAVCADRSGNTDVGKEYFEKTLGLIMPSPQFLATVYTELAGLYNQMSRADTALILLNKALQTNPSNTLLLFKIAYQYDYFMLKPFDALPWYREFLNKQTNKEEKLFNQPYQISYTDFVEKRIKEISK